jgi:hypothetical protein
MIGPRHIEDLIDSINNLTGTIALEGAKNREAQESILARRMEEDWELQRRWFAYYDKQDKDADVRNNLEIGRGTMMGAIRWLEGMGFKQAADELAYYGKRLADDASLLEKFHGIELDSPVDFKTKETP